MHNMEGGGKKIINKVAQCDLPALGKTEMLNSCIIHAFKSYTKLKNGALFWFFKTICILFVWQTA